MTNQLNQIFDDYESHYTRNTGELFKSLKEIKEFHLDRLPRWLPLISTNANILDAGCANGYLLSLLQEAGYKHLTGVDISRELAATARGRLPAEVGIHQSDVLSFLCKCPDECYDVIIFHHVLEHIPRNQTLEILSQFHRCLRKGGYLSLRTPNSACLASGYHGFGDFTHLVQFNERSMLQILEQAKFPPELVELVMHTPQLFWSWKHPFRAFLRILNRLRWHTNRLVHSLIFFLLDIRPAPRVHDWELELFARKQP